MMYIVHQNKLEIEDLEQCVKNSIEYEIDLQSQFFYTRLLVSFFCWYFLSTNVEAWILAFSFLFLFLRCYMIFDQYGNTNEKHFTYVYPVIDVPMLGFFKRDLPTSIILSIFFFLFSK